jgi:hypothetical protein
MFANYEDLLELTFSLQKKQWIQAQSGAMYVAI